MAQFLPPRRHAHRTSSTGSTTRRRAPILVQGQQEHALPPAAPDAPTQSCNCPDSREHHPKSISPSSLGEPYHVTFPVIPSPDNGVIARRSPSPLPPTPGAPRITPLDDFDIEDEDKNLVGIDRGYLRLGGRQLRYMPSPPATPPPRERDSGGDEEYDSATSKMQSQLDYALQYISAQAQMATSCRSLPQGREDSTGNTDDRDVDGNLQLYSQASRSSRSYRSRVRLIVRLNGGT
ncbi:hypothetical protein V8F20_005993 [Naviculisporaceae sp. PSN 640]